MFDLTVFPLSIEAGREQRELPGLLVMAAPRKTARMRGQDYLILYWKSVVTPHPGKAALTSTQQQEMLARLAETYYGYAGSVTAGLRATAARLNEFLLNRNLKSPDGQLVGALNMAVLHNGVLILGHAGSTHTFVLGRQQVLHFDDSHGGRLLGLSRQSTPRFYQSALDAGDLLLMSPDPPGTWTPKALANSPQLSMDHLRRRLLSEAGLSLQAAVVRFQNGKGLIRYWRPSSKGDPTAQPQPEEGVIPGSRIETPAAAQQAVPDPFIQPAPATVQVEETQSEKAESAVEHGVSAAEVTETPSVQTPWRPPFAGEDLPSIAEMLEADGAQPEVGTTGQDNTDYMPVGSTEPEADTTNAVSPRMTDNAVYLSGQGARELSSQPLPRPRRPILDDQAQQVNDSQNVAQESEREPHAVAVGPGAAGRQARGSVRASQPEKKVASGPSLVERLRLSLASVWLNGRRTRTRVGGAVGKVGGRVLPRREPLFNISPALALFVAVAVPLAVVATALIVYAQAGQEEQFEERLGEARQYAVVAGQQADPQLERQSWGHVYELVRGAERFGSSDESRALKEQSLGRLDQLEGLVRLEYQPVIPGGLGAGVDITKMVASLNDVYLLDVENGRILRFYRTNTGFDIDATFSCGPGQAGSSTIGKLVDLAVLPPNNQMRSTVMGVDVRGNLVYCAPNKSGYDSRSLAPPEMGWGGIKGITLYNNNLFVLDPATNAVYRYFGENGVFAHQPHLYFGEEIPFMADVIDLAVDQDLLYLLHEDGRMTVCEAARCNDPLPYGDPRPGFEPSPIRFEGATFTQLQTTQPPDPSLFVVDVANKSVYHLSLRRLNLQRQYRPVIESDFPLPNRQPTAFVVTPNRRVLLAFENQVYFAAIP